MNNKRLGNQFERELVGLLAAKGWWVHFLSPNAAGAQPFDVIAVKNEQAIAIDCKTSASHIFPISRLEENQISAFERWVDCGNNDPIIAIKYNSNIYFIGYSKLKQEKKIDINNCERRFSIE